MKKTTMQIGGATVTIIDKSSHAERTERLRKPLADFYNRIQKEERKNETNKKKTQTVGH